MARAVLNTLASLFILGSVLSLGCSAVDGSTCDLKTACPDGRRCDLTTHLCLADQPPRVNILAPAGNARISVPQVTLRGTVAADLKVTSAEVRVGGDAGTWGPLPLLTDGSFSAPLTLPAMDAAPLLIEVRAWDSHRQAQVGSVSPLVDTLAPAGTLSTVGNNVRHAPRSLSLLFTEPVTTLDGGAPLELSPHPGDGQWDRAHQTFTYSNLLPDTHYVASYSAGAVQDDFGHTGLSAGVLSFWTEPAVPASGATLDLPQGDLVLDFDVQSDVDGVATLVVLGKPVAGGSAYHLWGRFDPQTGAFQTLDTGDDPQSGVPFQAVAGVALQPDATLLRASGFSRFSAAPPYGSAYDKVGAGAVQSLATGATALVAEPRPCGAAPGELIATVNMVSAAAGDFPSFSWATSAPVALAFSPSQVQTRSASNWELLRVEGGILRRQAFRATDCVNFPRGHLLPSEDTFLTGLSADPQLSVALAEAPRSLYVSNSDGAANLRVEVCEACDAAGANCTSSARVTPRAEGLRVASGHDGGKVFAAHRNLATGLVELLERDATSCDSPWVQRAVVPDSGSDGVFAFKPVLFGTHAGVVLQEAHRLRFYIP